MDGLVCASPAQDPAELFDVVRADGRPTGQTKARAAVHRDGDWHRTLHVWVAGERPEIGPFLVLQQRSLAKDTWPGKLDATVGGHFRAGETLAEALREVEEEIGIGVLLTQLRRLGVRCSVNEEEAGIRDHEIQDVFLLRDDRPLEVYRPDPAELAALVRFPLPSLLEFFAGESESVTGERIASGASASERSEIVRADFIPTVDRYFYRVAIAARLALRGEQHVAV